MLMFIFILFFSIICALMSMIYKKKFFLLMLMSLESMLLKLLVFKFMMSLLQLPKMYQSFSLFVLTLSAVEASMGMSLMMLMSRKFKKKNLQKLKILKK